MTSPVLTDLSSGFEIDGSGILGGTLGDSWLSITFTVVIAEFEPPLSSIIVSLNTSIVSWLTWGEMKLASILFAFSRATFGHLICCHWYRSILPSLSLLSEPSRSTCELSTASRFFLTSASSVVFGMMGFDSAFWFELSTVTLLLCSFGTFFSVVCVLLKFILFRTVTFL